jgi:hypothetical protein
MNGEDNRQRRLYSNTSFEKAIAKQKGELQCCVCGGLGMCAKARRERCALNAEYYRDHRVFVGGLHGGGRQGVFLFETKEIVIVITFANVKY